MAQSDFGRALAGAERRMVRAAVELARTRRLLEREEMLATGAIDAERYEEYERRRAERD